MYVSIGKKINQFQYKLFFSTNSIKHSYGGYDILQLDITLKQRYFELYFDSDTTTIINLGPVYNTLSNELFYTEMDSIVYVMTNAPFDKKMQCCLYSKKYRNCNFNKQLNLKKDKKK